ncbi:MAG: serine/threonine phosphatase [Nostocaceae cyanobacterium]|nr:serine/threonine phosphatase [Nostocaceae cyanobacterium]
MLICPQCKFENPHTHKFCQNCGTSLTHKVCPQCSADVAVNAERCHECGAFCGTVWLAIIAKEATVTNTTNTIVESKSPNELEIVREVGKVGKVGKVGELEEAGVENTSASTPEISSQEPLSPLSVGSYLDPQQRYQVLELLPVSDNIGANTEACVRVLDCQPYQITPLEAIKANQQQNQQATIPSLAKAYLELQSQVHKGIPPIHDAWQHKNMQVVLIEDRSFWEHLIDLWKDETTTALQIVDCFYQMTLLWEILEPLNCRQSLLQLSNLCLDEDQALALGRLIAEPVQDIEQVGENAPSASSKPINIQALGRVWQSLFHKSQRTLFGSILQLLMDLDGGQILALPELQSRLKAIANEFQVNNTNVDQGTESLPKEDEVTATITAPESEPPEEITEIITTGEEMPTIVLPMQLSSLEDAGLTDVGRQRNHNEDYFGIETQISKLDLPKSHTVSARGLYILCDGMGGHAGGEVASELAVNTLRQYFHTHWTENQLPPEDIIRQGVRTANQAIYQLNQDDARSGVGRMGTTLVMVLIQNNQVAVAHVGDSRLYSLTRKQGVQQITIDHEVGQREIARGVEANLAYARPDAYQLTQALGPRDESTINPDVKFLQINEDTLFVLVSDGLSDNDLITTHWETHLLPLLSSSSNLESGVKELIDLANKYNGHDNITAVLIRAKVRPMSDNQKGQVGG